MNHEKLLLEKGDSIATITLNRPDKRNALDVEALSKFVQCLDELAADRKTRVIIITGAGQGFCTGVDVAAVSQMTASSDAATSSQQARTRFLEPFPNTGPLAKRLWACPKPTIAAINGVVAGFGVAIVCLCDHRIASDKATFTSGFIRRGLAVEQGLSHLLPRLMGVSNALEFLTTGESKDAGWAEKTGLVRQVVSAEELMKATRDLASRLATMPPLALECIKQLVHQGLDTDFNTQLYLEYQSALMLSRTEDFKEGVSAFLEKRAPVFRGR